MPALDAPKSVGLLSFDNANRYTLAGTNTLTINGSGSGNINVISGSHTISASLALAVNTNVNVTPATGVLSISGDTTAAAGVGITKTGAGMLEMKAVRADSLTVNAGAVKVLSNGSPTGTSNLKSLTLAGSVDAWSGKIDPGKVFDLTPPLDQVAEGYRAMDERRAIKALLRP